MQCYHNLHCAKLTVSVLAVYLSAHAEHAIAKVPLDYARPDGPSAIIALIRVPSKVPRSDKNYRGPILFNPGLSFVATGTYSSYEYRGGQVDLAAQAWT